MKAWNRGLWLLDSSISWSSKEIRQWGWSILLDKLFWITKEDGEFSNSHQVTSMGMWISPTSKSYFILAVGIGHLKLPRRIDEVFLIALMQCTRCTKSYHPSCCPSTICPLNSSKFVCIHHRFVFAIFYIWIVGRP